MEEKTKNQKPKTKSRIRQQRIKENIERAWQEYKEALENFKFNDGLAAIWRLISFCDGHIERERPWEKSENQLSVLNDLLIALASIAKMLKPFMPQTAERIFNQLGVSSGDKEPYGFAIKKGKPLFPRL